MSRLDAARELLENSETESLLITDGISARYISGFSSSNVALLITPKRAVLYTDFRYIEAAQHHCEGSEWELVLLSKALGVHLAEVLEGSESVSFQSNFMTVDQHHALQEKLPAVDWHPLGKEITSLFMEKTAAEIAAIAAAAAIADKALEQFRRELCEGVSEHEAAEKLDALCREYGSEGPSFDTIMLFGERSALPHGTPSKERLLKRGDLILTDFGCTVEGFCSDMTRTTSWGTPGEQQQEIHDIVLRAQRAGVAAVKAGVTASSVDAVCRAIIDDAGYGEAFGHGTGHGVGIRIHEAPALNKRDDTVLKPGMVVTVEPGIYLPDVGGVRIEDLLLVTDEGAQSLSGSEREIHSLGLRRGFGL